MILAYYAQLALERIDRVPPLIVLLALAAVGWGLILGAGWLAVRIAGWLFA